MPANLGYLMAGQTVRIATEISLHVRWVSAIFDNAVTDGDSEAVIEAVDDNSRLGEIVNFPRHGLFPPVRD